MSTSTMTVKEAEEIVAKRAREAEAEEIAFRAKRQRDLTASAKADAAREKQRADEADDIIAVLSDVVAAFGRVKPFEGNISSALFRTCGSSHATLVHRLGEALSTARKMRAGRAGDVSKDPRLLDAERDLEITDVMRRANEGS